VQLSSKFNFLPGGAPATIEIPAVAEKSSVYCARLVEDNGTVGVITVIPGTGQKAGTTALTLEVPDLGFGRTQQRKLVLVSFQVDPKGQLKLDSPDVATTETVKISNWGFAFTGAWIAVILAYLLAVLACWVSGRKYSWDPVSLTSGKSGRASLSKLQILGFTLLVLGVLVYVLLRIGVLSDISEHILLLLGISAVGTAGSKVAGVMKNRLSFDNWSWLRNQGWLRAYEEGFSPPGQAPRARWGDLLKTTGEFDVYSFQLATVSVVVAIALLTSDLTALASFTLPPNILALLGLSNVVYIGGKAVAPSVDEFNQKMVALRKAESDWLAPVTGVVAAQANQPAKQQAAIAAAPAQYQAYLSAAREAARMLKSLYSATGDTRFTDPILDTELMPIFP